MESLGRVYVWTGNPVFTLIISLVEWLLSSMKATTRVCEKENVVSLDVEYVSVSDFTGYSGLLSVISGLILSSLEKWK